MRERSGDEEREREAERVTKTTTKTIERVTKTIATVAKMIEALSPLMSSQNVDGKKGSEFTTQAFSMGRKSQDAAVGALVHMLRTAPPLRQDSSCYSSRSSKTELEGEVGAASGFFLARKTSDALEELRGYREMKDLLLSKSGTPVAGKEEA